MPNAINLVVKNGAASPADKTFTLISPAAGDGGIARWCLKEGAISAVFPAFTAMSDRVAKSGTRKLVLKFQLPSSYTESVTGLTVVGSRAEINFDVRMPPDFPEALKSDFVAFATNLFSTALIKEMIRDAVPAT